MVRGGHHCSRSFFRVDFSGNICPSSSQLPADVKMMTDYPKGSLGRSIDPLPGDYRPLCWAYNWMNRGHRCLSMYDRHIQVSCSHVSASAQYIKLKFGGDRLMLAQTSPSMSDYKVLYVASLCAAAFLVMRYKHNSSRLPYPPGPRGYPLIGSVLAIPRDIPIWKAFLSIAQKHSMCLTLAGVCAQLKHLRP